MLLHLSFYTTVYDLPLLCYILRYEILADLPDVDCVLVSVGGGGLISGIAGYLKQKNPNIKVHVFNANFVCTDTQYGRSISPL